MTDQFGIKKIFPTLTGGKEWFKLNLQQLNWVDQRLEEVYSFGFDDGQGERSEDDYDKGYKDGYQNGQDDS
jgi:hypothetical protein